MFTGLIQTLGVLSYTRSELKITCTGSGSDRLLQTLEYGDSVSVDGVCLTVEAVLPQGFTASASPETLSRSILGKRGEGAVVNLEASLRVGSKIGGHFVTGHVDGSGQLEKSAQVTNAWEMSFTLKDPRVARYIVPKGSIAVNGVSLTVADCSASGDWFTVAVIPVTYAETNLQYLQPGEWVNLEGDVLGKYVEKFAFLGQRGDRSLLEDAEPAQISGITADFLAEHGYL
ncbi:MAG: riboflavin synthase [Leptolyngbyaceae cyanobacterium SM1_1_3]|nr:riboflavin synthase [Leptolyngbyaceae cyanobacterium SM1_1_3]NJM84787.1 riboflavin synthase [Leptolyngbyaceae cyanobacterium RM2_2_21]NJN02458.1 riboflavin synthase [Leptolyngbyaceae cyanobacterium RM1_1_2]NJO10194.1 riboflavin synthase [Leptolyngbyaceae cyanobacterium SL_1_1]